MNLGDLHQVWEIKEWSDQLGIWAMPASHHSTGAVLSLRRVLRGMRVYALWVLAGCFLCLYGQDLRSFTFLLDRQVLEALDVLKKKPEVLHETLRLTASNNWSDYMRVGIMAILQNRLGTSF